MISIRKRPDKIEFQVANSVRLKTWFDCQKSVTGKTLKESTGSSKTKTHGWKEYEIKEIYDTGQFVRCPVLDVDVAETSKAIGMLRHNKPFVD